MTLPMMKTADTSTCNWATANELIAGKFHSRYALLFLLCLMHEIYSSVLYLEAEGCCVFAALLVCCVKGNCVLCAGRVLAILLLVIEIAVLLLCNAILNWFHVCCSEIVPVIGCCMECCLGLSGAVF